MGYGNLAYELEPQTDQQVQRVTKRKRKIKKDQAQMRKVKNLKRILYVVIMAFAAGFMISKFVAVHETQQQIVSMQKELASMQSYTSQKVFELEQSVDLTKIEQEASSRLGMQRPEKYQMIYVNVKQDDVTEVTAGEVESLGNRFGEALHKLMGNIIELFSIS